MRGPLAPLPYRIGSSKQVAPSLFVLSWEEKK